MESSDIIKSLKDSLFTGLISLALFGPIVGLKTSSKGAGLFVTPHWTPVVFLVVGLYYWTFFNWFKFSLEKMKLVLFQNLLQKFLLY